jgi:hypothetical protein
VACTDVPRETATSDDIHVASLTPIHDDDGAESQNYLGARQPMGQAWNFDHKDGGKRAPTREFFNLPHGDGEGETGD